MLDEGKDSGPEATRCIVAPIIGVGGYSAERRGRSATFQALQPVLDPGYRLTKASV